MKSLQYSARAAVLAGIITTTGCYHASARRERVQHELTGHSQALTTAVVDALELQPNDRRDPGTVLALELAREDQRIEGLPAEPIDVPAVLARTNRAEARQLEERFARIRQLLERQRVFDDRLRERGAAWEAEQRARLARRTKWIGAATLLVGGTVALCVFFPVCIPILGRLLAWLAGRLPSLASALGVVSVKAFDAVVRGVEKARAAGSSGVARLHNGPELASVEGGPLGLEAHLGREMDAEHKALVRARKAALKL